MKRLVYLLCFLAIALHSCNSKKGSISDADGIEVKAMSFPPLRLGRSKKANIASPLTAPEVVNLYGTWHQMGRQYGELGRKNMLDVLDYIELKLAGRTERMNEAKIIAERLYSTSPQRIKDFFDGVSETSGISLERIKLCNAVEYIEGCFFCSFMAVWDKFAEGKLVAGRNYDAASYGEIDKDIIVTIFHPDDGMAAAIVGYAGELYCVNGFNEKGLFIELNNGMPSAGADIHWELCPSTSRLLELLFEAETMGDVEDFFKTTQSFASFTIGVCNKDEARTYEWCYDGVKRGDTVDPEGLAISTNHYVNQEWNYAIPTEEASWNSITRRENLLQMAKAHAGNINVGKMEEIMSTSIEDGGPFHHLTRYQIVVIPADFTLYIYIPCVGRWSEINLKKYF